MRGAMLTAPLRETLRGRISSGYLTADFIRDWMYRFPDSNQNAVEKFVDRLLNGQSETVTRSRADEASLVLGLMPQDIWGEAWWD